jgi:Acyl-CoA carboxylase epsilon subunit
MVDDITAGTLTSDEGDARAHAIRFVTRDVSDEEAAAVTAVLLAALDEGTAAALVAEPARAPWVQSAGALRAPFPVGPGNWVRSAR